MDRLQPLRALIETGEDRLIQGILAYAKDRGYTRYTSTLEEAWRVSIAGLSQSLLLALQRGTGDLEMSPFEDYEQDPIASFGVLEARRHRERGVSLTMFLGLMKYYRQAYLDLVAEAGLDQADRDHFIHLVGRFYDRLELGFISEWIKLTEGAAFEELQAANRSLTNEKNKYLTLFESQVSPAFLVATNGVIADLNFEAARLFLGQNTPGAYYYRDQPAITVFAWLQPQLERLAQSDELILRFDHDLTTSEGTAATFEVQLGKMLDVSGKFTGTLVTLTDITERKRIEEERRELEDQMLQAQKLESLGVLAGGIAHDFNNLLMVVLGNAELALLGVPDDSAPATYLAEIEKASRRGADLCKQMLAYSGKGRFVIKALNLSEVVKDMAQLLEISISKKAALRYAFADDLPPIKADATQVRQIIMNLITNASEAVGEKPGTISIATGAIFCDRAYLAETYLDEDLAEGRYAYLEVSDSGCGMNEEIRARIFDPFFTTKFTGRGLGLAAVLGIVRGHRGAIKVYSETGRGTSIKVLFPAAPSVEEQEPQAAESPPEWRGHGTVILADDEESVLFLGRKMLERIGFNVVTAANGREAVELFRQAPDEIVCVILDLTMPVLDGEETFRELRRIRRDVRALMCSGYNEQEVAQRFVGKGLAGFIQKPYSLADLVARLREILGE